ncbi:MAG: hypothetical protein QXZ70_03285 [Candidatus Bathyarchaeia archaeon]
MRLLRVYVRSSFSPLHRNRALTPLTWLLMVPGASPSACMLPTKSSSRRAYFAMAFGFGSPSWSWQLLIIWSGWVFVHWLKRFTP